jgi:hypothetical protein
MHTPFDEPTPVEYGPTEAERIRETIMTEGAALDCPLCGKRLIGGGPGGRASHVDMWELQCKPCNRFIIVEDSLHP